MDPIEVAAALASAGPICDRCLGRRFAGLGSGLDNAERGRSLRAAASAPSAPSDSRCWACEGIFARAPEWAREAAELVAGREFATFLFGVHLSPRQEAVEEFLDERFPSPWAEPFKRDVNREMGKAFERALAGQGREATVDFQRPDVRFTVDLETGVNAGRSGVASRLLTLEAPSERPPPSTRPLRHAAARRLWFAPSRPQCPVAGDTHPSLLQSSARVMRRTDMTPNPDPTPLIGERVYLRPLEREDLAHIRRWSNDLEIRRLTGAAAPMTETEADAFWQANETDPSRIWFMIVLKDNDRVIGETGLLRIFSAWRTTDLTIILGEKDVWGRGYGTEVALLMLDYAFGHLGLHRVAVGVVGFNERALRFWEKVGFRREGVERDGYYCDHRFSDFVMMSILEHEYRNRHRLRS